MRSRRQPRTRSARRLLCYLGILSATAGCGAGGSASNPANVVLIVVDTLRPDFLGAYGGARSPTPHIDRLAADGIVFDNSFAPTPITGPSHAALFTSRHPSELGLVNNSRSRLRADVPVLAEILEAAGYATGATIALATVGKKWGFDRGFDRFEDRLRNAWILSADQVLPATLETLKGLDPPFFLWSHFADPHEPYRAHGTAEHDAEVAVEGIVLGRVSTSSADLRLLDLELRPGSNEVVIRAGHPFKVRRLALRQRGWKKPTFEPAQPPLGYLREYRATIHAPKRRQLKLVVQLSDQVEDAEEVTVRYALEVSFADRYVGVLLDRLRELGLYDESLIIFTSDHGEGLGCHGFGGHVETVYDCMVRVPLIIKPPRGFSRPTRRSDPAGLVDVMPTVLSLLGVEPRPLMRGRDLLAIGAERLDPTLFLETHRPQSRKTFFGLRGARHAVILDATEKRWELYDLRRDPVQHVNIFDLADPAHARWATRLRDRLRREARLLEGAPNSSEVDEATREMLRSLGYQ